MKLFVPKQDGFLILKSNDKAIVKAAGKIRQYPSFSERNIYQVNNFITIERIKKTDDFSYNSALANVQNKPQSEKGSNAQKVPFAL